MKRIAVFSLIVAGALFIAPYANAAESEVDRLLDLLVKEKVITQDKAVAFRADMAVKKQEDVASYKVQTVPEWTQNIKWGGDVRFRTRGDWGKTAQNQPQTSNPTNSADIRQQRLQESVRGRFTLDAKVNDFTYAGTRFVGGNTNPRSDDDTLTGYFNKSFVMFDQYYIRFEAPREAVVRYGKYFSDLKLWTGRFTNPFETSELAWDTDITTGGIALQYASPTISPGFLPDFKAYSNLGMVWIDENMAFNTDPILWGYQAGVKTEKFGDLDTIVNISAAIFDFANLQNKTPNANSAGTNSRVWKGDIGGNVAVSNSSALLGTYTYEYNVLDLLWRVDNERFLDWKIPHGLFGDFLYNASVHDDTNKGVQIGAYVGKNKIKDPGDWKAKAEWRYLERNAIPDFLPDSNFYGFGTYTGVTTTPPNVNGLPAAGGTNGKGIKLSYEYQLFKNTALNITYYWMEPIKSFDKTDPYNQFLFDVISKF